MVIWRAFWRFKEAIWLADASKKNSINSQYPVKKNSLNYNPQNPEPLKMSLKNKIQEL